MGLELRVSTGSPTPIYRQLIDQVRHAAAAGALSAGMPLPSVRLLAEQLVVNANTVAKAYSELVRDGVVEARQGRGFFVAEQRDVYSKAECLRRLEQALDTFLSEVFVLNLGAQDIRDALEKRLARLEGGKATRRGKGHE